MIKIEKGQVFSDNGKLVKDLKTGVVEKRHTARKDSTAEGYAEVDEKPKYSKEEYDNKVTELIRQRYRQDEEDAIKRKAIAASILDSVPEEDKERYLYQFREFNGFCEECKQEALNELEK